jgi:CBS domain-containing protein
LAPQGERARLGVPVELTEAVGEIEVGEYQDVEELGAGGTERVEQTSFEAASESARRHRGRSTSVSSFVVEAAGYPSSGGRSISALGKGGPIMAPTNTVAAVMTEQLEVLASDSPVRDAARVMRDAGIGDVIVIEDGSVCGIVTDRDIVVRGIASGKDPATTRLEEICSKDVTTVSSDTPVEEAVRLMRDRAVRRLPVVDGDRPVGVVSLGDLAVERDPSSALADISEAPPNT